MSLAVIACGLGVLLLGGGLSGHGAESGTRFSEPALKGAFTFNFTGFLTWPERRWSSPQAPTVIGVFGDDEVAGVLEDLVRRKPGVEHPRSVRRLESADDVSACHLVFVSRSRDPEPILRAAAGLAVLIVGDAEDFLARGGHIQFSRVGENVVFDVHQVAAEAVGLKISSKVLSLARRVVRPGSSKAGAPP